MANQTYFCILTAIGEAKDANAKALGTALKFTEMAVGDGNGALPTPDKNRTALVRQVRRAPINTLKPDPLNPGQLIAEQIIPEDVGGWWIRELGLYDDAGDLIAIGNCPETYKPQLAEGSGRVQVVRMVLIMSSAATVQLKVDPAVVLATRKYADDLAAQARQFASDQDALHVAAADPHPQYLTEAEGAARIQAAVQALVNSSPSTLDTLAELAAALNNDKDFAVTMTNALALKAPKDSPVLTGIVGIGKNSPSAKLHIKGVDPAFNNGLTIESPNAVQSLDILPGFALTNASTTGVREDTTVTIRASGNITGELALATGNNERARLDAGGRLLVGVTSGTSHVLELPMGAGAPILSVRANGGSSVVFKAATGYTPNASTSAAEFGHNLTTGRSINTGGTINASGADYAEYMHKADDCGTIDKGQIVGVDVNGYLTDKWAAAVSFLIKSTDPSYVGGDVWGNEEMLGCSRPVEPAFTPPEYTGAPHPGQAPGKDASDKARADYDTAMSAYQADQATHAQAHAAALNNYKTVILPAYQVELAKFDIKLEAARQKVDRIAYCGQVPCNVEGAKPGQYVVAVQDGEGIAGHLVDANAITFDQYRRAVGIVQNVLEDGRANVRVKPV